MSDDRARFWAKVDRGDGNGCWEWSSGKFRSGYGSFHFGGKNHRAHRYAWTLSYGSIPEGKQILHSCDNPSCVNPSHLFLGDDSVNVADMMRKGRNNQPKGERHCRAKLTAREVAAIRALRGKETHSAIAEHFNISRGYVCKIQNRQVWGSVNEG